MLPFSRFQFLPVALLAASCTINLPVSPAQAQAMNHGETAAEAPATSSVGQALLDKIHGLVGTWDAPMGNGVMTDMFKPFAFDTAVLGEEWLNGKQITSTVFYVINGELRADHYCDQPRHAPSAFPRHEVEDRRCDPPDPRLVRHGRQEAGLARPYGIHQAPRRRTAPATDEGAGQELSWRTSFETRQTHDVPNAAKQ
jgi:hypothetical protein